MKKYFFVLFVLFGLVLPVSAAAAGLPAYNSVEYCAKATTAGGSQMTEAECMGMEEDALTVVATMRSIDPEILSSCDNVAKTGGGSYRILKDCIEKEIEAKKNLEQNNT